MIINKNLYKQIFEEFTMYPEDFQGLSPDAFFSFWFLTAFASEDLEMCRRSLTGASNDGNCDAIFIDEDAESVLILQSKFRDTEKPIKSELKNDVDGFFNVAGYLLGSDDKKFKEFIESLNPEVRKGLVTARERIIRRRYRVSFLYVTTGKVSPAIKKSIGAKKRPKGYKVLFSILDNAEVSRIYGDYIDGIAPPIPEVELRTERLPKVENRGHLVRVDRKNSTDSYVVSVCGREVAKLFEAYGKRIFARNIRGYVGGNTSTNRAIIDTLKKEPENFFYYNNGVTIVCDEAAYETSGDGEMVRIHNPQIINGQQTTRALAENQHLSDKASLIVKIIKIPRAKRGSRDKFNEFVSNIVAGTNRQNAISNADLMSNDDIQIKIERELKKYDYLYIRKKQKSSEAKANIYFKPRLVITKENMARAIAGCQLDPVDARSGVANLFGEDFYHDVFPNKDVRFYLTRYWAFKCVSECSKGNPEWGYAKWVALKFIWGEIGGLVDKKDGAKKFRAMYENKTEYITFLEKAIGEVFAGIMRYFKSNRGSGSGAQDVSNFFRSKKQRDIEFGKFWNKNCKSNSAKFNQYLKGFKSGF